MARIMAKLIKIITYILCLLMVFSFGLLCEREYNSPSYNYGLVVYEDIEFDEEFVNYINEHNIKIYKPYSVNTPYYYHNSGEFTKPIKEINLEIESILYSENNTGPYYFDFTSSDVSGDDFETFLFTNYQVDGYYYEYYPYENSNQKIILLVFISLLCTLILLIKNEVNKYSNLIKVCIYNGKTKYIVIKTLYKNEISNLIISFITVCFIFLYTTELLSYFIICFFIIASILFCLFLLIKYYLFIY